MSTTISSNTRKLVTQALLAAVAIVLVAFVHFPLIPAAPFLEYDPADIPILICGFAFGPVAGLAVTLIASFIQGFTVSAQSGIYGIIMHIIATGAYVLASSLFYKKHKTKKWAAVAIVIGTVTMVVCMFFANLIITPYFMMGAVNSGTVSAVLSLMPFILLFNLIKAGVNGLITFFIYKRVKHLFLKD